MSEQQHVPPGVTRRQFGVAVAGTAAVITAASAASSSRSETGQDAAPVAVATSFGSVAIERATRSPRRGGSTARSVDGRGHGHGGERSPLANLTWGDVVVVWMVVVNQSGTPVRLSPGQVRLQIAGSTSVTPRGASVRRLDVAAASTERFWVSYLAPSEAPAGFLAEFTDPVLDHPVGLALPTALPAALA
ncbi:hypothetical protein [Desertivibrio insolitus]|uniref:hypothetical protein n=1 Tax=Herbiconiux sp. SYSU D00978 TaxID=2812562 RepID=UPI001A95BB0F|nr:hypothetical protein [Herbiconiux sp. SYSU D00978]